jgi:hypothetical protein
MQMRCAHYMHHWKEDSSPYANCVQPGYPSLIGGQMMFSVLALLEGQGRDLEAPYIRMFLLDT